jgi:quinol-cytochrome oxidoreductase complex cytochrome b subunit
VIGEFVRHLFPRVVLRRNLKITYTFCLGGLAFTSFLVLIVSGLLLMFYYRPAPDGAYRSILFLEGSVWGGHYLRALHRFASHALLVLLLLHMLRVVLTGAYRHPRHGTWVVGTMLLFLAVAEAYTGYLLPLDQLAYWATQTGMELLRRLPLGEQLRALLVPDRIGGALSLLRFFAFHVAVVPILMLSLVFLHFFRIRRQKGVLPYL